MTTEANLRAVIEAVFAFFAEHRVASLRLPSGWFGRPCDNQHQLTEVGARGDAALVRLDHKQVLMLDAEGTSSDDGVLRVAIRSGHWHWTEYGADTEHHEVLGPGTVEFHAPIQRTQFGDDRK